MRAIQTITLWGLALVLLDAPTSATTTYSTNERSQALHSQPDPPNQPFQLDIVLSLDKDGASGKGYTSSLDDDQTSLSAVTSLAPPYPTLSVLIDPAKATTVADSPLNEGATVLPTATRRGSAGHRHWITFTRLFTKSGPSKGKAIVQPSSDVVIPTGHQEVAVVAEQDLGGNGNRGSLPRSPGFTSGVQLDRLMRQEDRNPPRRGSFAIHQPSSTRVDKPLPKIPSANSASTAQYLLPSNAKATSPAAVSPNFDTGCQGTHILNLGSYGVWVCNDPRPLPGTLASWRIFEHLDDPVLMIEPIAAVPEAADQSQGTKKSRLSKIFRMGRRSQQATQGIATSLSDTHVATGPHGSTPPANVETIPAIGDSNTTLRPFTPTCDLLLEAELQHIHDRRQEAARHLRDDIVQYFRGNQTCSSASLAPSFRQWLSMTHQPDSRPRDLQDGKAGHSDHPVTVVSSAAAATNRPPRSLQALWSLCNPHNKRPTTPQVAGEAERMNANRPVPAGDQWETRAVAALAWQKLLTDGKLPIRLLETILDSAQEDGVLSVRKVEAPKVEMADQGLSGAQYLYAAQDSDNDSTFTAGSWDGSI